MRERHFLEGPLYRLAEVAEALSKHKTDRVRTITGCVIYCVLMLCATVILLRYPI